MARIAARGTVRPNARVRSASFSYECGGCASWSGVYRSLWNSSASAGSPNTDAIGRNAAMPSAANALMRSAATPSPRSARSVAPSPSVVGCGHWVAADTSTGSGGVRKSEAFPLGACARASGGA